MYFKMLELKYGHANFIGVRAETIVELGGSSNATSYHPNPNSPQLIPPNT